MKSKSSVTMVVGITVLIFLTAYIIYATMSPTKPTISTIHVINMDKDVDRWKSMKADGDRLGLPLQRFSAVNGKELTHKMCHSVGIGRAMLRPDRKDKEGKNLVNLGTAGCFLSHRGVLTQCSQMNVSDFAGHLILEDDLYLPDDFLQPGGRWDQARQHIPGDYDIILFGLWHPHGTPITPTIMKLASDPTKRINLGTYCYVVRHGALKSKILPWLQHMVDAYDDQLSLKYGEWNVYGINPRIVELNNDVTSSSINEINGSKN
jgi:GR25 family glycosyltransferase involved in LPS biosynthesis